MFLNRLEEEIMDIALFVLGVYHILFGMIMKVENLLSFSMFKAIPFLGGVYTCWYAAKAVGWV